MILDGQRGMHTITSCATRLRIVRNRAPCESGSGSAESTPRIKQAAKTDIPSPPPDEFVIANDLCGEAASAPTALHRVRIVEREAAFLEPLVKVDGRTVEEQGAFLVDGNSDAMLLGDMVRLFIGFHIEAETVLKTAASTTGNADSQNGLFRHLLLGNDSFDFTGCVLGNFH